MKETFTGVGIATEDNCDKLNGEFAFSNHETGCINDDGSVFYNSEGLNQYIFNSKEDAFDFLFNGEDVVCQHSYYVGSREDDPDLEERCLKNDIGVQKEEDGSEIWSAWKSINVIVNISDEQAILDERIIEQSSDLYKATNQNSDIKLK